MPHDEQSTRLARVWYHAARGAVQIACRAMFAYRVRGAERLPRSGALLLLANHQSYLDPLLIPVACPRHLRFMARDSLFKGPLGRLIDSLGAIPIDRDGGGVAGLKRTLRCLADGQAVLLFPEGTRSGDGALAPLKPGFLALVRRRKPALAIVAIDGAHEAWPRGRRYPRPRRISVQFGRTLSSRDYASLDDEALLALVTAELQHALELARSLRHGGVGAR
jgi:1-acyl-sn-glycerol-3-phosphate acyltransferase